RAPNRRRGVGRGEVDLAAVVVAEFEQRRADLQALGAFHEPAPIRAAAKLAVGRDFQPNLFLHTDRGADAVVLNARELVVCDLVAGAAPERLAQRLWSQQAAHVIGAKRRGTHRAGPPAGSPSRAGACLYSQRRKLTRRPRTNAC